VVTPGAGSVAVRGRVSALLELGAGFNPQLSGIDNIRQFCLLHGMHDAEIDEAIPRIVAFSELRDAIEHPVTTYSSGMAVRLGFSCAVYVHPEILIVDEALSVGDAYFQNKCMQKIRAMLDQGTTFLYVTHAADSIRSLCNQGLWLQDGRVRQLGTAAEVGAAYQREVFSRMVNARHGEEKPIDPPRGESGSLPGTTPPVYPDNARREAFRSRVQPLRAGSGEVRIDDIVILDESGSETDSLSFQAAVCIRVVFHAESELAENAAITVGITDSSGKQLVHFNSGLFEIYASGRPLHIPQAIEFSFVHLLCPGEYGLVAGVTVLDRHPAQNARTVTEKIIDYCAGGARFSVLPPEDEVNKDLWGVVHFDYHVTTRSLD
jgi:lipopolysaccharide transport system ATP-binding protein